MITEYLSGPPITSAADRKPCVMALGYFDGVHLGHRKVISTAKEIALQSRLELAVMTFSPHPKEILAKGKEQVQYLMPLSRKETIMAKLGVDKLYVVEFNEAFASLSPDTFVSKYLIGLRTVHVVVGFDFQYGSKGKGNADTLEAGGKGTYRVTVVPQVACNGQKISSTLIRSLLQTGDVQQVAPLLGDYYETRGVLRIENGFMKQQRIQAEFLPYPQFMLPSPGIYQIRVEWSHKTFDGIASVESCERNQKKVYLEMLAPIDERWGNEHIDIKWVNRLDRHVHRYVDVELPMARFR